MKEKEIQNKFIADWEDNLRDLLKLKDLRLYAIELNIKTDDGVKRADLVYEIDKHDCPMDNPMFVVELKKDKIDVGVCEQVSRYAHFLKLQLYRKSIVKSVIAAPSFSNWELKTCKEQGIYPLQFDLAGNMRLL